LPAEVKTELLQYLRELTRYNQELVENEAKYIEQISELQRYVKKVQTEAQNEVDDAEKLREFWQLAY
jgi:uncharacterized protein with PhoU and TrkA domain